jgi:hypothetical protein
VAENDRVDASIHPTAAFRNKNYFNNARYSNRATPAAPI